jgi:hypothetical protein
MMGPAFTFGAAAHMKMPKTSIPWPMLTTILVLEFPVTKEMTTAIRMLPAYILAQVALSARAGLERLAMEHIAM